MKTKPEEGTRREPTPEDAWEYLRLKKAFQERTRETHPTPPPPLDLQGMIFSGDRTEEDLW